MFQDDAPRAPSQPEPRNSNVSAARLWCVWLTVNRRRCVEEGGLLLRIPSDSRPWRSVDGQFVERQLVPSEDVESTSRRSCDQRHAV